MVVRMSTYLQVLKVGQGLAVGELHPRVAVVEFVADTADIAHHRHQEVHTLETDGRVCGCPTLQALPSPAHCSLPFR
jgi:hypothetical protein